MKAFTTILLFVACAALLVLAKGPAHEEPVHAQETAAVTDPNVLFANYQKAQRKLAHLEAAQVPAEPAHHEAAGEIHVDAQHKARSEAKSARKLEQKRAELTQLKEQLEALGVDVVAKEQEAARLAAAEVQEKALNSQFSQAWIAKLEALGRTEEANHERNKALGIKQPKLVLSPSEKAQHKLNKLKSKVEREEFRLQWLADHAAAAASEGQQLSNRA